MHVQGCNNCPNKGPKVGSAGNPESTIVFVGESPGRDEQMEGEPFVGAAGNLLKNALPVGFSLLDDAFVTNAAYCFPTKYPKDKKNTAVVRAVSCCNDRLIRDIMAHPRNIIVALGNGALWSLTGNYDYRITQERGRLFPSNLAKRGILASVHPAFLLRGGGSLQKFRQDMQYAIDLNKGESKRKVIEPEIKHVEHLDDLLHKLSQLDRDTVVAVDQETSSLDPREGYILNCGITWDPNEAYVIPRKFFKDRHSDLEYIFMQEQIKYCYHNGKFDIRFLRYLDIDATLDHDTMLMSYVLDETRGIHGLEQVAADTVGAQAYKDDLQQYLPTKRSTFENVPPEVLAERVGKDASYTLQAFQVMLPKIEDDEHNKKLYYQLLIPVSDLLVKIEMNGLTISREHLEDNRRIYEEKIALQTAKINKVAEMEINTNSHIQVKQFFKDRNIHLHNTRKETLEKNKHKHPLIPEILEMRGLSKTMGTYIKGYERRIQDDGKVYTTFNIHGTVTGRLSSSDPNVQNIPRDPQIRRIVMASPGNVLLGVDLNQAELRCLAALSEDPKLMEIYRGDNKSIHHEVSIELWGEDWPERHTEGHPDYVFAHEQYMRTKILNFGIVYGITAPSIAEQFKVSASSAEGWIKKWADGFPKAWEFLQVCKNASQNHQNLLTVFGRRKRFSAIGYENLVSVQNQSANFPEQSTASDIVLDTAKRIYVPLVNKYTSYMVNLVHDELIVELKNDKKLIEATAKYIIEEMELTPRLWGITNVPFVAEAKVGQYWGMLKSLHV